MKFGSVRVGHHCFWHPSLRLPHMFVLFVRPIWLFAMCNYVYMIYIYIYTCVYIHIYTHVCVYIYIYTQVYVYTCVDNNICICMHLPLVVGLGPTFVVNGLCESHHWNCTEHHIYIYIFICIYMHTCICIYLVHTYIYIYIPI